LRLVDHGEPFLNPAERGGRRGGGIGQAVVDLFVQGFDAGVQRFDGLQQPTRGFALVETCVMRFAQQRKATAKMMKAVSMNESLYVEVYPTRNRTKS
jgi:hypothetical protein